MMEQFSVIRKHLKKKLDPRRFEHTLEWNLPARLWPCGMDTTLKSAACRTAP